MAGTLKHIKKVTNVAGRAGIAGIVGTIAASQIRGHANRKVKKIEESGVGGTKNMAKIKAFQENTKSQKASMKNTKKQRKERNAR